MKLINISTPKHPNTFCKVDDEDFDFLNQWKWYLNNPRNCYARRGKLYMHRFILNVHGDEIIDHIDGDTLNNTRENLRVCSSRENANNRKKVTTRNGSKMSSRYKGVHFKASKGRFCAQIVRSRKSVFIGYYSTEIEAALAYNEAAIQYHGNFAKLNTI